MRKAILELIAIVSIFFGGWFVLYQVDWMRLFRIETAKATTEEKLGKLLQESLEKTETIIKDKKILDPIDSLIKHVCEKNFIDPDGITVWVVERDEVNAFAMPGRNLVIYTGLIADCENEAELCGVICHEIGHMELDHVMKKVVKEVGLSVIVSMTTGNKGGSVREVAKLLSSTAYDRDLEREADQKAVEMLVESEIDAEPMANFMFRLAQKTNHLPKQLFWISSHPDSEERAIEIVKLSNEKRYEKRPVLPKEKWEALLQKVSKLDD